MMKYCSEMTKVSDMLKDYAYPQGNLGYADSVEGEKIAMEIRRILNLDLYETDIVTQVEIYHSVLTNEHLLAASLHLNPRERRAWRTYLCYDEFLRNEKMKHVD